MQSMSSSQRGKSRCKLKREVEIFPTASGFLGGVEALSNRAVIRSYGAKRLFDMLCGNSPFTLFSALP